MFYVNHPKLHLGSTAPPLPWPRVTLRGSQLEAHAGVWGRTGSGKSKLLQSVFTQTLERGEGVGLIEPHHDLSFDSLTWLIGQGFFRRPGAFKRLVYLDFGNGAAVPFNVLKGRLPPHTRALNALEAMLRVWPELSSAPMFQTLFLSSMMVLMANELPITHLYPLLTDGAYRQRLLQKVEDPLVVQAFDHFEALKRDRAQLAGSTLRRAFLLTFSPITRLSLGQPDNWLDFRALMDEGRAVILNLGNIQDEETRKLLGAMLMVQIEQAALSRTDLAPAKRRPFTLLVDEWPSFAAQDETIGTILSQARKFNLRLWLAAQSMAQIGGARLAGALENCRLSIVFGLGRDSAEIQARHVGHADTRTIKEPAKTDTQHPQYYPLLEQWENWVHELQTLPPRWAYVKNGHDSARRMRTLTVRQPAVADRQISSVLATYRAHYQREPEAARQAAARDLPAHAKKSVPEPASHAAWERQRR